MTSVSVEICASTLTDVAMAMEEAEDEGIEVKKVVANDDVPSAPLSEREKRRGSARVFCIFPCFMLVLYKCLTLPKCDLMLSDAI